MYEQNMNKPAKRPLAHCRYLCKTNSDISGLGWPDSSGLGWADDSGLGWPDSSGLGWPDGLGY